LDAPRGRPYQHARADTLSAPRIPAPSAPGPPAPFCDAPSRAIPRHPAPLCPANTATRACAQGGALLGGCFGSTLFTLAAHTGAPLWHGTCEAPLFATPCADLPRRTVYAADLRGCLLAARYGDDGRLAPLWRYRTAPRPPPHDGSEPIFSSPLVCPGTGAVCFGSMDRHLHCVSPDGQPLWTFDGGAPIFSAPAFAFVRCVEGGASGGGASEGGAGEGGALDGGASEGVVFFSSQLGQLFCVRVTDGTLRWHQPAEVHGHSSPAVDSAVAQQQLSGGTEADGARYAARVVCIGAVDGTVHAFACADGAPLATRKLAGAVFSSPAVCASRVVVGCRDDRLYCLELREMAAIPFLPDVGATAAVEVGGGSATATAPGEDNADEEALDPKMAKKLEALRRLLGK